jgi:hypothetical protein
MRSQPRRLNLYPRRFLIFFFTILAVFLLRLPLSVSAGDDWQPINPDELKMTSVPEAPGAPAVYLYRQVDRDDQQAHELNYVRIKILKEEGRKYGDVEIPFFRDNGDIHSIKARTIRPDGSIANFDGKVYEKTIVKAKGLKYLAKTFTLPDVQVGGIIEYHYMKSWDQHTYYSQSQWILSDELFTKYAKFSLKPLSEFALRWSWPVGLPNGTQPPKSEPRLISLESRNIAAFQIEDYMPPQNELKYRIDFVYTQDNDEKEPEKFWKKEGKKQNSAVENFTGKRKAMEQAVAEIVAPGDSPEVKAQKIYYRVQKIRNLSFEAEKTEQEQKRDKQKEINNVEDVWKRGYANGRDITWLYLGLARAAGLDASAVVISRRSDYFFKPQVMNANQLNDNVVMLKLNGKDVFCDPGTAFAPFGLLPWSETGVQGLRLDKDGGSWVVTTLPESATSRIERKADLQLSDEGALSGKVTMTFTGLEALYRRQEMRSEDETSRKKFLEDQLKEYIPVGIDVELKNKPDWEASTQTLVAEYEVKVQGWASGAGRRVLVPVGLFSAPEKHIFEHTDRVHPIYFSYPSQEVDDITIEPPLVWQVSTVPDEQIKDAKIITYKNKVENNKGTLHLARQLDMNMLLVDAKYYMALRSFFQFVRTGDEGQIILQPATAASRN